MAEGEGEWEEMAIGDDSGGLCVAGWFDLWLKRKVQRVGAGGWFVKATGE